MLQNTIWTRAILPQSWIHPCSLKYKFTLWRISYLLPPKSQLLPRLIKDVKIKYIFQLNQKNFCPLGRVFTLSVSVSVDHDLTSYLMIWIRFKVRYKMLQIYPDSWLLSSSSPPLSTLPPLPICCCLEFSSLKFLAFSRFLSLAISCPCN